MNDPRIPGTDLTRVLDMAADLQRRADGERDGSITLSDLEHAASQAGIEPRFVRAAARSLALERRESGEGFWGPADVWSAEARIRGEITSEDAHRVLARLQSLLPVAGGRIESPSDGIWRLAEGSRATVQITREGDEVGVQVVSDRSRLKLGLILGGAIGGAVLLPQIVLPVAIGVVGPDLMDAIGYLVGGSLVTGAAGGGAAGLGAWKAMAARWRRRADAALDQIRDRFTRSE